MTASAFFGYFLLSCGTPLVTWIAFIQPSSFLVLTAITAVFCWLSVLLLISIIFRAFVPVESVAAYAAVLLVSVLVEELFRLAAYWVHVQARDKLKVLALRGNSTFSAFDETRLAYTVGWGHGLTHVMFQFLPFLPLTWHDATTYNDTCPEMSVFLVSCISQVGMFHLLSGNASIYDTMS